MHMLVVRVTLQTLSYKLVKHIIKQSHVIRFQKCCFMFGYLLFVYLCKLFAARVI